MKKPQDVLNKYLLPTLILLTVLVYFPVCRSFIMAFQKYNLFNLQDKGWNNFDNFRAVFNDLTYPFGQVLLNTFVWVCISLVLQFMLGFGLALLLRKPFRGRGLYTSLVFYPWALSGFAIGLVWSWIFNGQFGLANDVIMRLGIVHSPIGFLSDPHYALMSVIVANVWYGIPFFGIMILAALQSIPNELYESAKIDGANWFTQLFRITIPYIKPTLVSTTLLRVMWIMNFPEIIYGMTNGGPANATNILATEMLNKIMKEYNYGQASAIGLIIMMILFVYSFFYLRFTSRKEIEI
ncbi:MAG TPA: sugar ABC transporter permease [Spirochaetales bacterium]|nr:sugar ABC transporter permease [Spirochaetales bacterium]